MNLWDQDKQSSLLYSMEKVTEFRQHKLKRTHFSFLDKSGHHCVSYFIEISITKNIQGQNWTIRRHFILMS